MQNGAHKLPDTDSSISSLEQKSSYGGFANLAEEFDARTKSRELARQAEPLQLTVDDKAVTWTDDVGGVDVLRHGPGIIDERTKKFDLNEMKIAELLAAEGKKVEARAEGEIRTSDAYVDGTPTEFKAIVGARIPGSAEHELPTDKTVKAALNSAKGQLKNDPAGARTAILDGREHGLTRDAAEQGMRAYLRQPHAKGKIDYIRVLGDDWEINWP